MQLWQLQKPMSGSIQLQYIPVTAFSNRISLEWRLPWECLDQSQEMNWYHCVIGPELPFFHIRKGLLKIDQFVKMPWHRLSMGVACSYSSAPGNLQVSIKSLKLLWYCGEKQKAKSQRHRAGFTSTFFDLWLTIHWVRQEWHQIAIYT